MAADGSLHNSARLRDNRVVRFLPVLLLLALPALADEVELSSGEVIRDCKVTEEGEYYRIAKGPGSRLVLKSDVRKVTYSETAEDAFQKKLKELKADDAEAHAALAKWCAENKLAKRAEEMWKRVIEIDPDHEEARGALGYQRHLGKWMTQDEIKEAQGLVRHKGRWVTPEERDLDIALEEQKELDKKYLSEVKKWVDRLSSSDEDKVKDAKANLAKLDDKYKVKPYLSVLRSSNQAVRLFAVTELTRIKDELLKASDATVVQAGKTLARLVVWDESLDVRAAAMKALGAVKHAETAVWFVPFLEEDSATARIRAEDAISQFPSLRAFLPLLGRLNGVRETLAFIAQYEKQAMSVIKGMLQLRNGQKVPLPPNLKFSGNLFDPEMKKRLGEEKESVLTALRAIAGQDFGEDVLKWKDWYDKAAKKQP
jgi:hypothetical protein